MASASLSDNALQFSEASTHSDNAVLQMPMASASLSDNVSQFLVASADSDNTALQIPMASSSLSDDALQFPLASAHGDNVVVQFPIASAHRDNAVMQFPIASAQLQKTTGPTNTPRTRSFFSRMVPAWIHAENRPPQKPWLHLSPLATIMFATSLQVRFDSKTHGDYCFGGFDLSLWYVFSDSQKY